MFKAVVFDMDGVITDTEKLYRRFQMEEGAIRGIPEDVMMENIVNGQHVEEYELYIDEGSGKFKKVGEGEVIGYKRIHKIAPVEVARVKIKITSYRGNLELQSVTLY